MLCPLLPEIPLTENAVLVAPRNVGSTYISYSYQRQVRDVDLKVICSLKRHFHLLLVAQKAEVINVNFNSLLLLESFSSLYS